MNYLKKKINKEKRKNRAHDDDDAYDFIPAVPLHPDELARKQREEEALFNGLSEEEKERLLEERKRLEEEKKKEEENKKQSSEAWKFFEQLNQRVTDTVIRTDDLIEKLKDSTTADELTKAAQVEAGFASPEDEEPLQKGPQYKKGSWIGFSEQQVVSTTEGAIKDRKASTTPTSALVHSISGHGLVPDHAPVPVTSTDSFDFDSAFDATTTTTTTTTDAFASAFGDACVEEEGFPKEEEGDDPFDTSYVDPIIGVTDADKKKDTNNNKRKKAAAKEAAAAEAKRRQEEEIVPVSTRKVEVKSIPRPKAKRIEQTTDPEPVQHVQRKKSVPKEVVTRKESIPTVPKETPVVPKPVPKETPVVPKPAPKETPVVVPKETMAATDQEVPMSASPASSDQPMDASEDADGDPEFDPEVTNLYLQRKKEINSTKYGSNVSLASILSNPFLNEDFDDDPLASAISPDPPPADGGGRKSSQGLVRRMSTNPFEDEADGEPIADPAAESIAALTADFVSAVEEGSDQSVDTPKPDVPQPPKPQPPKPNPPTTNPGNPTNNPGNHTTNPGNPTSNPGHNPNPPNPGNPTSNPSTNNPGPPKPPPPPQTIVQPEQQVPDSEDTPAFDPFQTIHDDAHHSEEDTNNPVDANRRTSSNNPVTDSLVPPSIPAYPSDVSDNEEEEEPEIATTRGDARSGSVSGVVKDSPTRKMSIDRKTSVDSTRKMSLNTNTNPRKQSVPSSGGGKPFDPFQRVDDSPTGSDSAAGDNNSGGKPAGSEADTESIAAQHGDCDRNTIASNEFDDNPVEEEYDPNNDPIPSTNPTDNDPIPTEYEPETFDENLDPFDTSIYNFEPVKDAIAVTDETTFDAFSAKFQSATPGVTDPTVAVDAFSSPLPVRKNQTENITGFGSGFGDPFTLAPVAPIVVRKRPPKPVKKKFDAFSEQNQESSSSSDDEGESFKIVIKARVGNEGKIAPPGMLPLLLPPPPKTPVKGTRAVESYDPTVENFLKKRVSLSEKEGKNDEDEEDEDEEEDKEKEEPPVLGDRSTYKRDSQESPSTPLYDTDISQPLEEFPKRYEGDGWEMYIRYPAKKKLTGNRFWKKIYVRISENSIVQLYNKLGDPDPFQELPLQPSYQCSEICAQQFDQFGKIFTLKLMYIFYKERVGVRKGQIAKVIGGQITSFGSFAKLGMPLDHAPQETELIKLGSNSYDDMVMFNRVIEELLFRLPLHRDRALTYKTEEIQITVQDDYYVEQNKMGSIIKQLARVRIFFLAFINGMPGVEIGVNDMTRQGKEIVGRYDIIPVVTEEWIRIEDYEFHSCVMIEEFEKTQTIKLIPPDATYFELMRFRVRPPRNRELPLQVTCNLYVTKTKVELRCEILVPGAVSRKHGQIPCEDIQIRIHIPECWIYFFRTEKHMRFGSVKSANRRTGKIKGLERFLGAATSGNLETTLMESTAGVAKYEHHHHSLVWRIPRLPKEGQGAYTQQLLNVNLPLTTFDQVPENFYEYVHVEFTMPSTTVSHAVVRSVSVTCEEPPEKFVRNVSRHEYKVQMGIHFDYEQTNEFQLAATVPRRPPPPTAATPAAAKKPAVEEEDEDSDESE